MRRPLWGRQASTGNAVDRWHAAVERRAALKIVQALTGNTLALAA